MVRTSSFETPLLRVSRPVAACSRCRGAKTKCDGKLPACTACERTGRANECSSANDPFAKGKERSYVAYLEARVEKLEQRLAQTKTHKSSSTLPGPQRPAYNAKTSRRQSGKERKETSDIDELVSDFGFLAVNATARDFYGFTSAMSYARLVLSASSREALLPLAANQLPPRHLATQLIQHYLDNVFILLPFFSETVFFASIDALYHDAGRHASDMDHWTVRMALAIAALSLSQTHGDARYLEGVSYAATCLNFAEKVLHPGSIAGIQATLFLIQYAMLDPHHFDCWYLVGVASRAMVDLGLHEDPPPQSQTNKAVLDIRRRVYYCVYSLDRSLSMVQGRAFSFSDDSTNVTLPACSSNTSAPGLSWNDQLWLQPLSPAVHLFRVRLMQSAWYQELFQSDRVAWAEPVSYMFSLIQELKDWREAIPHSTPASIKDLFELEVLYSHIHASAPNGKVHMVCEESRYLQFLSCLEYAEKIATVTNESSPAFYTFYDALRASFVGAQFLETLWTNQDLILSGEVPKPLATAAVIVPLPSPGERNGNAPRAIKCIEQLTDVLELFGHRWGYMTLRDRFRDDSSAMLNNLRQKQAERIVYPNSKECPIWRNKEKEVDLEAMLKQEWTGGSMGLISSSSNTNGLSNA
ncbi:MAG: hypothetical protein M1812_001725 [Candelaria pacifica]|nr:MAG: hypothetical protein M1812_001725 [Candelaria pacifica]